MNRMTFVESFLVAPRKEISKIEYQKPVQKDTTTITADHFVVTEVINPKDKRNDSKIFHNAKNDKIRGLITRNTWSAVNVQWLPTGADIIGGKFANVLKIARTEKKFAEARYVAQGYNDKMKLFVVHDTPTLRQSSIKIIVNSACLLSFRISLLEITQAYLQSKQKSPESYLLNRRTNTGNISW